MDLSTTYLGLNLKHPLMLGALTALRRPRQGQQAEDAGVAAIVMHSLFEEQIKREQATAAAIAAHGESSPEAASYLPAPSASCSAPTPYLEQIRKVKATVSCPVIGSLNGVTPGGWGAVHQADRAGGRRRHRAQRLLGAHDPRRTAAEVEARLITLVGEVVGATKLRWR
jgi:dihydroorotate dehydrogenase (fumarate)